MNTPVVKLRQWVDADLDGYAEMNRDPEVMRYFFAPLTREESAVAMERQRKLIEERGWGLWALDVDGAFAGFTGLAIPRYPLPFMPCVEVGWRLKKEFWGKGIAYAAACQSLDYGFKNLKLGEIVSFTTTSNLRSRRLMERLGLQRDEAGDFDHPLVPEGHPLRRHVLYRLKACGIG